MSNLPKKWPMAAAALLAIVLGGMIIPWVDWDKVSDTLEQFTRRPKIVIQPKAKVLLVSAHESDQFIVRNTVEPRGYELQVVSNSATAREILAAERDRVEVVVVDLALPGSQTLIQAAKTQSPHAHLITLHGRPVSTELSALLIAKAVN
jgi:DNA-binding NarL/FixJ family response regulator